MDRRKLVVSLGAGIVGGSLGFPLLMPMPDFSRRSYSFIEPDLTPGTPTARYTVERPYPTATLEPLDPGDCFRQLYPHVKSAIAAFSGVQVASDLEATPNMVLLQQFEYLDGAAASDDFDNLVWQTKVINAHKFRAVLPGELNEVSVESIADKAVIYEHVIANGRGYAVVVARSGNKSVVVRADQFGIPPTSFVMDSLATLMKGSGFTVPAQSLGNIPMLAGWNWSYGPIDILRDVTAVPACEVPTS